MKSMGIELWSAVPHGAREAIPGGHCPRCRSTRVHRSRVRNSLEGFVRSCTPVRPFACSSCKWRGWRIPVPSLGSEVKLPPLPEGLNRHRPQKTHKRVDLLFRYARQFIVVVLMGIVSGIVFTHCQRDAVTSAASEPHP